MLWSRLFNDAVGPEPLHQLLFVDETAMIFDENTQGVENLPAKGNHFIGTEEAALGDFQLKRSETKDHGPVTTLTTALVLPKAQREPSPSLCGLYR
jgi:hypothetical protein